MCSRLPPPPPPQKYKFRSGQEKNDIFFIDRKEKREVGKGGEGKKGGRKKEGKKERRQKKECKRVFRHFQFCVVDYPPSHPQPQKYKFGSGAGKKNDPFFIDRNEEKKKGRREKRGGKERRKEGKKEGRKERKEAKKECKCVFRHFQFHVVDYPHPHPP